VLLLYINGLVDSPNQQGEMFGAERLDDTFRRLNGDHMVFLDRLFAEIIHSWQDRRHLTTVQR